MSDRSITNSRAVWLLVALLSGLISGGLQLQWWLGLTRLPTEFVVIVAGTMGVIWLLRLAVCIARFPLKTVAVFLLTFPTLIGPGLMLGIIASCAVLDRCI